MAGLTAAISKIFSGTAGGLVEGIASGIDRFVQTDDEKQAVRLEIERIVTERIGIAEESARATVEGRMQVVVAELKSGDQYVSHTRPMIARWGLYIILWNYGAVPTLSRLVAAVSSAISESERTVAEALIGPLELPFEFWAAWGGIVGTYAIGRSFEKMSGTTNAVSRLMSGTQKAPRERLDEIAQL